MTLHKDEEHTFDIPWLAEVTSLIPYFALMPLTFFYLLCRAKLCNPLIRLFHVVPESANLQESHCDELAASEAAAVRFVLSRRR